MSSTSEGTPPTDRLDLERVHAWMREGAKLYNVGEFWEAHEAWEAAWHRLREAGEAELAELVQGLILVTAAFENLERGKPRGFATQGAKALSRMRRHQGLGGELGVADEQGFYEAFLDVYLLVQRAKIGSLEDDRVTAPELTMQG